MRFSQDIVIITRKMDVYVLIDCLTYSAKHCIHSQDKNIFNNMYIFYMVLEKWENQENMFWRSKENQGELGRDRRYSYWDEWCTQIVFNVHDMW